MFPQSKVRQKKSKKAVSVIIGYVLLITFAVIIGVVVYKWMKTYVPQEELNCPGETSLFIKNVNYNCSNNILTLTLINNGKFDIGGYFIYASNSPDKKLATIDLTLNQTELTAQMQPYGIKLGSFADKNSLGPGDEEIETYNITGIGKIYSVEIVPIRWQTEDRKMTLASCKDAKVKESVYCFGACTPNCGIKNCGTDGCGGTCGSCNSGYNCAGNGTCMSSACTPNCGIRNCGMDPVCGTLSCGSCNSGYNCAGNGTCMKTACFAETDPQFCLRLNKNCNSVTALDNCSVSRTANCGSCTSPQTCNATNMCSCFAETNTQFCTRLNKNCGSVTALDNCSVSRTVDCGTCSGTQSCNSTNMCSDGGSGGITCLTYCLAHGYADSYCFSTRGQCTSSPGGHYEFGGNSQCTQPGINRCCCYY
jgi:hypothetical protein